MAATKHGPRHLPSGAAVAAMLAWLACSTSAHAQPRADAARAEVERLIGASGAEVSLAFRTLDGKRSLLIEPDRVFHAASTMKVAVMVELFAQARAKKLRLEDELPVTNEFHSIVDGSVYQLEAADDSDPAVYKALGQRLTLRRLCEAMITVSSNLATNLLIEKLGVENIRARVKTLKAGGLNVLRGVEDGKAFAAGKNNTTTARGLMVLLERIAKHKAVSREADEEMLAILKRQKFVDAIPAGVPPGTVVANKTGEITRIHHDAAIVYGPRPYVLVVLVRGIADRQQSAALIASIARAVHPAEALEVTPARVDVRRPSPL